MRRKICLGSVIFFITCLLSLNLSLDANALDFRENGQRTYTSCVIDIGGFQYNGIANNGSCTFLTNTTTSYRTGWVNSINMGLNQTLPGKSLIILSGRYTIPGDYHSFVGFQGTTQLSVLSSSFSVVQTASSYQTTFQYVLYTPYPLANIAFDSPQSMWVQNNETRIDIHKIDYITLTDEPTQQQLQSIISTLGTYNQNLSNIASDTSNIWQYLQDKEDQEEEDRDNIEQQSSDNQDSADDAGDEADQAGQTLMQAFGSFITALTSVHETNCMLPNMSVYSLNFNNMNLCEVSPPQSIMALASIGMVLIIVPLGINLVKRMISLYKEITG